MSAIFNEPQIGHDVYQDYIEIANSTDTVLTALDHPVHAYLSDLALEELKAGMYYAYQKEIIALQGSLPFIDAPDGVDAVEAIYEIDQSLRSSSSYSEYVIGGAGEAATVFQAAMLISQRLVGDSVLGFYRSMDQSQAFAHGLLEHTYIEAENMPGDASGFGTLRAIEQGDARQLAINRAVHFVYDPMFAGAGVFIQELISSGVSLQDIGAAIEGLDVKKKVAKSASWSLADFHALYKGSGALTLGEDGEQWSTDSRAYSPEISKITEGCPARSIAVVMKYAQVILAESANVHTAAGPFESFRTVYNSTDEELTFLQSPGFRSRFFFTEVA